MEFLLRINLDNADARDDGLPEGPVNPDALGGYLRQVAGKVQGGTGTGKVRDLNGNFIGEFDIVATPSDVSYNEDSPWCQQHGHTGLLVGDVCRICDDLVATDPRFAEVLGTVHNPDGSAV